MDATQLAWSLRLQETEALLQSRQEEHAVQRHKRQTLELQLVQQGEEQIKLQRELAQAQLQHATASDLLLGATQALHKLRGQLADGTLLSRLYIRDRIVSSMSGQVRHLMQQEAERCNAFQHLMADHEEMAGADVRAMETELSKLSAKQAMFSTRCSLPEMEAIVASLQEREALLRVDRDREQVVSAKQLAATAALQERLDSEARQQQQELAELKAQLTAAAADLAAANDHQVVNEQSLEETRQQSQVLRQRQLELDAAVQHAHHIIYHLAGTHITP